MYVLFPLSKTDKTQESSNFLSVKVHIASSVVRIVVLHPASPGMFSLTYALRNTQYMTRFGRL